MTIFIMLYITTTEITFLLIWRRWIWSKLAEEFHDVDREREPMFRGYDFLDFVIDVFKYILWIPLTLPTSLYLRTFDSRYSWSKSRKELDNMY